MANKGTDAFKRKIKKELDLRAFKNPLFEKDYIKENKNLDNCIDYIIGEVQSSGSNGFEDDEIYGMAVHYYTENDLKVKKSNLEKVVVNHTVKLTAEEIQQAKNEAREQVIQEEKEKMRGDNKKPVKKETDSKDAKTLFE